LTYKVYVLANTRPSEFTLFSVTECRKVAFPFESENMTVCAAAGIIVMPLLLKHIVYD